MTRHAHEAPELAGVEHETYALALAAYSDRIVAAVHDRQDSILLDELAAVLALSAPEGVNPFVALVTVLCAQVPPPWALPIEMRLGWVEAADMQAGAA